jgi:hypothetical protein
MKKCTILFWLALVLCVVYLIYYEISFYDFPFAVIFLVYLIPIILIEIVCVLLRNMLLLNMVFLPIHCWITASIMNIPNVFEHIVNYIFINLALTFIIGGYTICVRDIINKNSTSTIKYRVLSILPISTRFVLLILTVTIFLLYTSTGYEPCGFHCIAYVFCPTLYFIALVLAFVYPKDISNNK